MEGLFDIIFEGRILPGRDPAQVKAALGELFKAPADTVERLFNGNAVPIKKNIDHATAIRYIAAMKDAGALARIKPVDMPDSAARAIVNPGAAPVAGANAGASWSVAPAGSTLVEPQTLAPRKVDTSSLSIAEAGSTLGEKREVAPVAIGDLSQYSVAEIGATLGEHQEAIPLPEPDLSALSLAETGATLGEPRSVQAPPIAAIAASIAPVGSTLDTREKAAPPPPPKTDHLKLS